MSLQQLFNPQYCPIIKMFLVLKNVLGLDGTISSLTNQNLKNKRNLAWTDKSFWFVQCHSWGANAR